VNKINEIDNTYRNFQFEVLAGDDNTDVTCKENKCLFKFDFRHVYWNPRLSTEHERIVNLFKEADVIYDVFAGVGPFSIPAATKTKCMVLANDLNPYSYKYLVENYSLNRSKTQIRKDEDAKRMHREFNKEFVEKFQAFNLDGNNFIKTNIKNHLLKCLKSSLFEKYFMACKFYVVMNLPAMATEFLVSFNNLFSEHSDEVEALISAASIEKRNFILEDFKLNVFCYCFAKDDDDLLVIKKKVSSDLDCEVVVKSHDVRKVAPNKEMYCLEFNIPFKALYKGNCDGDASLAKKIKLDEIENKI
jgi:tRNA (guanine37-N1)-methyltransferase